MKPEHPRETDSRKGPGDRPRSHFTTWMLLLLFCTFMVAAIWQSHHVMSSEMDAETHRLRGISSSACRNLEEKVTSIRDDFRLLVSIDAFRGYLDESSAEKDPMLSPLVKRFFSRHQNSIERIGLILRDGRHLILRILPGNQLAITPCDSDHSRTSGCHTGVCNDGKHLVLTESVPTGENSLIQEAHLILDQDRFFSSELASYMMGHSQLWIWRINTLGESILIWNPSPLSFRTLQLEEKDLGAISKARNEGLEQVIEHRVFTDKDIEVISALSPITLGGQKLVLGFSIERQTHLQNLSRLSLFLLATFVGTLSLMVAWFFHIYRRISHSEQAETMARKDAEMAAGVKSDFVASMSHEIRTPLNGVLGYAELMKKSGLNPEQHRYMEIITRSGRHLLSILNDILDFSRLEAGAMKITPVSFSPVDLAKDVISALQSAAHAKQIEVFLAVEPSVPATISGDPKRIRQILFNLVGNAIKFTPEGYVSLRIASIREDQTDYLRFSVADTGIGIPSGKQEEIFEPFKQIEGSSARNHGGTGLGLAICKRLASQMNGTITIQPNFPKGSIFSLAIVITGDTDAPTLQEQQPMGSSDDDPEFITGLLAQEDIIKQNPTPPATGTGKVLVVDDNLINRMLINDILTSAGISCELAGSGAEALSLLDKRSYILILMDVEMPGLDGIETTKLIRKRERELELSHSHIMGLSAHAFDQDRRRALRAGMDGYMIKPVDFDALIAFVKDLQHTQAAGFRPGSGP